MENGKMDAKAMQKVYDDLFIIFKIATIAKVEYPSMTLHQEDIKLLLEVLRDRIKREEED